MTLLLVPVLLPQPSLACWEGGQLPCPCASPQPPQPPFHCPPKAPAGHCFLLSVPQVNFRFSGAVQTRPQLSLAIVSTAFLSEP